MVEWRYVERIRRCSLIYTVSPLRIQNPCTLNQRRICDAHLVILLPLRRFERARWKAGEIGLACPCNVAPT